MGDVFTVVYCIIAVVFILFCTVTWWRRDRASLAGRPAPHFEAPRQPITYVVANNFVRYANWRSVTRRGYRNHNEYLSSWDGAQVNKALAGRHIFRDDTIIYLDGPTDEVASLIYRHRR